MNDSPKTEAIEPLESSADGKRNSYTLSCIPMEQKMNYAACLWRQGVLERPDIKTPADWAGCGQARRAGTCTALQMRAQEEAAGRSIFFRARDAIVRAAGMVREWVMPSHDKSSAVVKRSSAQPRKPTDMLDAMGDAGSLADAVTEAAKAPSSCASVRDTPVHRIPAAPLPTARPGETPLQMAMRLKAERAGHA